jgi:uncharacterized protein YbaA (DUF1428 family)
MGYVDGFLVPVPEDALERYRELATLAGTVWLEHGALSYVEAVADDVAQPADAPGFAAAVDLREGETVLFAFITYRSREHRDDVNARVVADPRMQDPGTMPFDPRRMAYGGFRGLVERP